MRCCDCPCMSCPRWVSLPGADCDCWAAPPRCSPPPGMFWADAKATPANSAAVLIKSLFLIGTVPLVVPRAPTPCPGVKRRSFHVVPHAIWELPHKHGPGNFHAGFTGVCFALARG